jgi:hypothetical protein
MARLFTFGCSFTQYMWPTWAHIVGYDMGIEFHNFALAGLGNVGIQHRIVEADLKYNFQEDDIIMIMWTSWCREDRVKNGTWMPAGSILNLNDVYDHKFVKKYWDYSNDIVKNSTAIITVNKMYKNNIKWQGSGFPLHHTEGEKPIQSKQEQQLIKFYQKSIPKISHVNTTKTDMDKIAFESILDCHPDVEEHLSIVEEHVYKKLNLTIKQETKDEFLKVQETIKTYFTNYKIKSSQDRMHCISVILSNKFPKVWEVMKVKQLID